MQASVGISSSFEKPQFGQWITVVVLMSIRRSRPDALYHRKLPHVTPPVKAKQVRDGPPGGGATRIYFCRPPRSLDSAEFLAAACGGTGSRSGARRAGSSGIMREAFGASKRRICAATTSALTCIPSLINRSCISSRRGTSWGDATNRSQSKHFTSLSQ